MIKYIDKGTASQHLIDRLMESALNNVGSRADVDAVFLYIAKNRLPVWLDELETYEVSEVKRGRWVKGIGENGVTSACFCSKCNFEDNRYSLFNYCPNCGAKMNEVGE